MIKIKRVYEVPATEDGYRVLVDRLWPRGVSKQRAALDLALKEIAPSPKLRTWFNHEPAKFQEFRVRYEEELRHNPAVDTLLDICRREKTVTLAYAARDATYNHVRVLLDFVTRPNSNSRHQ